jgi:glucose-6-phosphate isomerase, archaeal
MKQNPFVSDVSLADVCLTEYDNHIVRALSSMKGQYLDRLAFEAMLQEKDEVLYEVYEIKRPEVAGELTCGLSIVHPGKVGDEYFMTKGHFHSVLDTAEVYHGLKGEGVMVMETPEGEWAVEELRPGRLLYVPPRWAHRSVNTGVSEDLVTLFVYPANAGHDYGAVEQQGMRKLVVEHNGRPRVIDNPRWKGGRID